MIKAILLWLWTKIRSEMTIQKPVKASVRPCPCTSCTPEPKRKHKASDAAKGIMLLIIAPVIFFMLAMVIGL